jgi:hypothetical protein
MLSQTSLVLNFEMKKLLFLIVVAGLKGLSYECHFRFMLFGYTIFANPLRISWPSSDLEVDRDHQD